MREDYSGTGNEELFSTTARSQLVSDRPMIVYNFVTNTKQKNYKEQFKSNLRASEQRQYQE